MFKCFSFSIPSMSNRNSQTRFLSSLQSPVSLRQSPCLALQLLWSPQASCASRSFPPSPALCNNSSQITFCPTVGEQLPLWLLFSYNQPHPAWTKCPHHQPQTPLNSDWLNFPPHKTKFHLAIPCMEHQSGRSQWTVKERGTASTGPTYITECFRDWVAPF